MIAAAELLAAMNTDPGADPEAAEEEPAADERNEPGGAEEPEEGDDLPEGVSPLGRTDPSHIGEFELLGRVGAGGMGAVFLGRDRDGRLGAVKLIRPEYAADPSFLARFQDEVALADRVSPFCTAQVLDHGITEHNRPYLVTEYVEGMSLERQVLEHGALPAANLHGVAVGVAAALTAIHAAGLVHRDLKPANVILSWSGPRVIDFGIARAMDAPQGRTQKGIVLGSPGWMSPEQLAGAPVTPSSDIFNWGCLVAFAANGRHPFGEGDPVTMAGRMMHGQADLGELEEPLRGLAAAAMSKDPSRRPTARYLMLGSLGRPPEAKKRKRAEAADSIPDTRSAVDAVLHRWQPPAPPPYRRPMPPRPMPGPPQGPPPGPGRPPRYGPPQGPPPGPRQGQPPAPPQGPQGPPQGPSQGPSQAPRQGLPLAPPQGGPPPGPLQRAPHGAPQGPPPGPPPSGPIPVVPSGPPSSGPIPVVQPAPGPAGPGQGGPAQTGPAQAGPGQAGAAPAGPGQGGPAQGGPAQGGPAQGGPAQGGSGQLGLGSQADAGQDGPGAPQGGAVQGAGPGAGPQAVPQESAPGGPQVDPVPPSQAGAAGSGCPTQGPPGSGGAVPPAGPPDPAQSGPIPVIPPPPGRAGRLPLPRLPARSFPWWIVLAGALFLLVVLLGGLVMMSGSPGRSMGHGHVGGPTPGGKHEPEATMSGRSQAPDELGPQSVPVGEAGADAGMRFRVTSVDCDKKQVGTAPLTLTAKGMFCVAETRLTNGGDKPAALAFGDQKLYDTTGKSYSAVRYSPDAFPGQFVFDQLKPGETVSGPILFDIPASAEADRLVLHGDGSGEGLTVRL